MARDVVERQEICCITYVLVLATVPHVNVVTLLTPKAKSCYG